jgi:hypothetical protein
VTLEQPERLRRVGTADERDLLERASAEPISMPGDLRRDVLRGIDARLARRRAPLLLALIALLAAGSAVAGWARSRRPPPERPRAAMPVVPREAPPVPEPRPARAEAPLRRRAAVATRAPARPVLFPAWDPGPNLEDDAAAAAPPAPRLSILREGEPEVSLIVAADRVVGSIRGTPLALAIEGTRLTGKMGTRNVWLWLHGHQAEGDIGGIPVRFELVEVDGGHELREGYSVRTALPPSSTRVSLMEHSLRWSPSCGAPLPEVAPGTYQGLCASGRRARVVLPSTWGRLPPLAGSILLSFFLTERDPSFGRLFE